ncbi:hypothetical protein H6P81_007829 [Aristolochia fimbriata]|uniref:Uncharacterized protein n=1 Tax=Aristolochia fimbriata TaxID=158543 RepID=A0AAV7F1C2_ARIFI|nr:hypothetical protein H6P81_007829 [Aristolochia fimbriata]
MKRRSGEGAGRVALYKRKQLSFVLGPRRIKFGNHDSSLAREETRPAGVLDNPPDFAISRRGLRSNSSAATNLKRPGSFFVSISGEEVSNPDKEYTQLRAAVPVGVHHVISLRILGPHHALEVGPHVGELLVWRIVPDAGDDAGAHGNGVQELHQMEVLVAGQPLRPVPRLPSVAVHGPERLLHELDLARVLLLALQGDPHQTRPHLLQELRRRDRELEEEYREAPGRLLNGQADPPLPVPEEGPRHPDPAVDVAVVPAPVPCLWQLAHRADDRKRPKRGVAHPEKLEFSRMFLGIGGLEDRPRRRRRRRRRGRGRGRRRRREHGGTGEISSRGRRREGLLKQGTQRGDGARRPEAEFRLRSLCGIRSEMATDLARAAKIPPSFLNITPILEPVSSYVREGGLTRRRCCGGRLLGMRLPLKCFAIEHLLATNEALLPYLALLVLEPVCYLLDR